MEQRLFSIPIELDIIRLTIAPGSYTLRINSSESRWDPNDRSMVRLVKGLQRWSHNTFARLIKIDLGEEPNGSKAFAIAALCRFNADKLLMRSGTQFELPKLTYVNLLGMANKIREISIDHVCTALEATDLCTLRGLVLNSSVLLESLSVDVRQGVKEAFAKECLKVTIVEENSPVRSIQYKSEEENPGEFGSKDEFPAHLIHFEGCFRTDVFSNCISFKRTTEEEKYELYDEIYDVELNKVYTIEDAADSS